VQEREALGQYTWRGVTCAGPEASDEQEGMTIANLQRRHARWRGRAGDGEPDEIVPERQSPDLLMDPSGHSAAEGFIALERVRLHFVEAELEFPALMVERRQLSREIGEGIEHRREQRLRPKAGTVIAHGAHVEARGELGMEDTRGATGDEIDQRIARAERLRMPDGQPLLFPREPVSFGDGGEYVGFVTVIVDEASYDVIEVRGAPSST
jgi:hypothetical protein